MKMKQSCLSETQKENKNVIPAKAGIQTCPCESRELYRGTGFPFSRETLDSRLRTAGMTEDEVF